MKKALLICVMFFAIAAAGIGGWYMRTVQASRGGADKYVQWAGDQKVIPVDFAITVPSDTPADQTLYLSGDTVELGNWDGAGVPMKKQADGLYHATVPVLSGVQHAFKVTRGTWGTVERGAGGVEIPNHFFVAQPGNVVAASVLTWVDNGKTIPGLSTRMGLFREHKKFESKYLGNFREIIVYLPPGYDSDTTTRYPVLYMQDGQNLFDASTSFAGVEWRLDKSAQNLITNKRISPVIIVGIYNTPDRTAEFTPFAQTPAGDPGKGALYEKFVVEELKPMIDQTYRTQPDRSHTAVGGSSMGGQIALSLAHDNPDIFGAVAVLDPWLHDGKNSLLDAWTSDAWMKQTRFYVDMGSGVGAQYPTTTDVQDANALAARFRAAGLNEGTDFDFAIIDGAEHNEAAWQQRTGDFLTFLYGSPSPASGI